MYYINLYIEVIYYNNLIKYNELCMAKEYQTAQHTLINTIYKSKRENKIIIPIRNNI